MEQSPGPEQSNNKVMAARCSLCRSSVPDDEQISRQSGFLKALSDPARIRIVYALSCGDLCNCHLMHIMDMPQTAISHHMKVLKYAGIVKDRRMGKWINYSLADRKALEALRILEEK